MPDLEPDVHSELVRGLTALRDAYGRYLHVVDAQRAALHQNNHRVVRTLGERLDGVIREIRNEERRIVPSHAIVVDGSTDGPLAQEVRDLMTATAADAATARASVQELTRRLTARRDELARALDRLELPAHPLAAPTPRPTVLDAAG